MAGNSVTPRTTPSWVESWSAVTIVGIIFATVALVGAVAVFKLEGGAEVVAVITALAAAGGTIVGALTGVSIGGAGRAAAEQRAEAAATQSERDRATAAESQKKLEMTESESRRNRDEVETQGRSASDAQEALDGAFRLFTSLEDKIHRLRVGEPVSFDPEELGKVDKGLIAVSEALYAITRQRPGQPRSSAPTGDSS